MLELLLTFYYLIYTHTYYRKWIFSEYTFIVKNEIPKPLGSFQNAKIT